MCQWTKSDYCDIILPAWMPLWILSIHGDRCRERVRGRERNERLTTNTIICWWWWWWWLTVMNKKKSDDIWKQKGNMNILLDIITEICVFCWILFILSSREREKEELFFLLSVLMIIFWAYCLSVKLVKLMWNLWMFWSVIFFVD